MEIKLDEDFKTNGLCSWISFNSLKDILTGLDQGFSKNNELSTKITGFIINENGIQIQKEYRK